MKQYLTPCCKAYFKPVYDYSNKMFIVLVHSICTNCKKIYEL